MRILLPILLLLTAGCGDREREDAEAAARAEAEAAALAPVVAAADPARIQALVDRAFAAVPGGASAKYRNLRGGSSGAACGEVALQSPLFRPFVVSPDGVAIVATGPAIAYEDPSDLAADAWIRWCATREELQALEPRLRAAEAAAPPAIDDNLLAPVPLELPPPEVAPPPKEARARPAAPTPPQQIDSFFNSVQRPGQQP